MTILGITPFENADIHLAIALQKTGSFPVISLGRNKKKAILVLDQIQNEQSLNNVGIYFPDPILYNLTLPSKVTHIIIPPASNINTKKHSGINVIYQVTSLEQAQNVPKSAYGIIVKGNECSGQVGDESSFILFQQIRSQTKLPIWVQGGMGMHTGPAVIASLSLLWMK